MAGRGGTTSTSAGGTTSTGGTAPAGGRAGTGGAAGTFNGAGGASGTSAMFGGAGRGGSTTNAGGAATFGAGGITSFGGAKSFGGSGGTSTMFGGGGGRSGAAGSAAGGMAGSAGASSSAFTAVAAVFNTQCGKSGCHSGRQSPNLTSANLTTLYSNLTNTAVRQCGSDHLVTKSDTANSAVLELAQHQCGTFVMPDGCTSNPCLSSADMTTLTSWIQAGAPGP